MGVCRLTYRSLFVREVHVGPVDAGNEADICTERLEDKVFGIHIVGDGMVGTFD